MLWMHHFLVENSNPGASNVNLFWEGELSVGVGECYVETSGLELESGRVAQ